jgi:NAD(P)-dependent dehydrogenase (short-subunit alcohol dehydrogenase family)
MQDLEDKVAVVTGAASGIGRGIAEAFARERMRLVLADLDRGRLQAEADRLRSGGAEVEAVATDVSDLGDVGALADATIRRFGTVNIICNNAGTIRPGRTWELPLEDWKRVLEVNLLGTLYGVHTFVPLILATGEEGHVVNVGSMASVIPVPGIGPYNVSKHGVLALSEVLEDELRAAGAPVGVSLVMPGRVRSRLGRPPEMPDDESAAASEPGLMEPEEVGSRVVEAIRAGTLFVFTHPERVEGVRARFARITGP